MSLISHLYHGELGEWCVDRLIGWKAISAQIADATRGREEVRPEGKVERRHWFQVERAFGLRMAALVQPAPPYAALLGLVRIGLVTRDRLRAEDQVRRAEARAARRAAVRAGGQLADAGARADQAGRYGEHR